MNGHLQLSINLKDHEQITAAINLLSSLIPITKALKPISEQVSPFYAVATKGDLVKLSTTKFKHPRPQSSVSEKARKRALKRKRDKQGHFLRNEQNKK